MEEGERSEKEIMHKSLVRRAGGGISGNFHIIGYARRGSKGAQKLNKKTITLRAGAKKQLKVKNLKKKQKVKWKSSKKKIATVSKKGLVRAKKNRNNKNCCKSRQKEIGLSRSSIAEKDSY